MNNTLYLWIVSVTLAVCLLGTAAMLFYTMDAYEHSSIIYYIATEWW